MTKLQELKADYEAAQAARVYTANAADAAEAAYHAAWDAYWAELNKTQEENSND
jgi:hypothetical protein